MSEIRYINIIHLKMINSFIYISLILYISYLYNLYILKNVDFSRLIK